MTDDFHSEEDKKKAELEAYLKRRREAMAKSHPVEEKSMEPNSPSVPPVVQSPPDSSMQVSEKEDTPESVLHSGESEKDFSPITDDIEEVLPTQQVIEPIEPQNSQDDELDNTVLNDEHIEESPIDESDDATSSEDEFLPSPPPIEEDMMTEETEQFSDEISSEPEDPQEKLRQFLARQKAAKEISEKLKAEEKPSVGRNKEVPRVKDFDPEEFSKDEKTSTDIKSFLAQRKKDAEPKNDENDPYGADQMAKKYLLHLQKYLEREDVDQIKEIVINKPMEVGLEYADGWKWVEDPALTQDQLDDIARMLANRSGQLFHPGNPILSVKMPGGHRVQIVAGFNAPSGFVFAMRLARKENFTLEDFDMDPDERERVKELAISQKTMLISGGTGTGKTSFLNALIPSIPDHERLITMEDVPELKIPHRNWAPLIFSGGSGTVGDQGVVSLLNACLRLRPDRIILGEIRKENAFAFCSAINTGHEGSLATIHANNPKMAIEAVINRVLMNGDLPDSAITTLKRQLLDDIYAVVQLKRVGPRVQAYIKELSPEDKDMIS